MTPNERPFQTYNLVIAEDFKTNQYGQDPNAARRLVNFIPSRAGDLKRKDYSPPFTTVEPTIAAQPAWYSYAEDHLFYPGGTPQRQYILAVSNNISTQVYKFASGGGLTALPAGAFENPANVGSGWVGDPLILYSDGLLFISDEFGPNGTVYDGTDTWKWGLDIPAAPSINSESTPGSITVDLFAEYVITERDSVRRRESPPSLRARFTPPSPGTYDVTLDIPARTNVSTGWTAGAADKVRIYRSSLDGSTELFLIAEINASDTPQQFIDTVPFFDVVPTAMQPKRPPFRNQKKPLSLVGTKWNNRFILRDGARRSRAWVSGFREVIEQQGGQTGNPLEMFPGARNEEIEAADPIEGFRNFSDFTNAVELPDESAEMRGFLWWQDGLMIGTEKTITTLWGRNPEEWRINNSSTYGFGIFSKSGFLVTPHGLIIFSADRKLWIDPVTGPSSGDRTDQAIDLGWPIQDDLNKADARFTNRFQMRYFTFGSERDWLVLNYTTQVEVEPTGQDRGTLKIYDFSVGGWLSLDDIRATCVGVLQEDQGYQFLVAGDSVHSGNGDRKLKVVTGYTADSLSSYQAAASRVGLPAAGTELLPANTFRTTLLDLQSPDTYKIWRFLSFYKQGDFAITVTAWFDPPDVDNLGVGIPLDQKQLRTNEFQMWIWHHHKRVIFEFTIPADANHGALQGLSLNARDTTRVSV